MAKLTRENASHFFTDTIVGNIFSYDTSAFIWDEVVALATSQGKRVIEGIDEALAQLSPSGIVVLDIKESAKTLQSEEIMRLRSEINTCYQRIEDLETQAGIRGVERLQRCELCKQPLYPYQGYISTESGGTAHTDCQLLQQIEELQRLLKKREEAIEHWTKEAQKFGEEHDEIVALKEEFRERCIQAETELGQTKLLFEESKTNSIRHQKRADIAEKSTAQAKREKEEQVRLQERTVISVKRASEVVRRAMKTIGDYTESRFTALPSISMDGVMRENISSIIKPAYDDMNSYLISVRSLVEGNRE